jgi:hypothetical protein
MKPLKLAVCATVGAIPSETQQVHSDTEPQRKSAPAVSPSLFLYVCGVSVAAVAKRGLKEIEAAINSDRSLFRPWQRDTETSVFI